MARMIAVINQMNPTHALTKAAAKTSFSAKEEDAFPTRTSAMASKIARTAVTKIQSIARLLLRRLA